MVFKDRVYYFGGYSQDGDHFHDLHVYDPEKNNWEVLVQQGELIPGRLILYYNSD